jgi:hypothetical protein
MTGRSIRRVRPRGNACHTYNRNVIERIGSGSHGQLGSRRRLGCGCVGCGCRSAGWAGATDAARATGGRAPERRVHRIDKVEARASHRGRWCRGAATAVGRAGARPGVTVLPKSGILRRQTRPRSSLIVVGYCCRAQHTTRDCHYRTHTQTHTNLQTHNRQCVPARASLVNCHLLINHLLECYLLEYSNTISSYDT